MKKLLSLFLLTSILSMPIFAVKSPILLVLGDKLPMGESTKQAIQNLDIPDSASDTNPVGGTAFVVKHEDEYFIITATHVVDRAIFSEDVNKNLLYIKSFGSSKLYPVRPYKHSAIGDVVVLSLFDARHMDEILETTECFTLMPRKDFLAAQKRIAKVTDEKSLKAQMLKANTIPTYRVEVTMFGCDYRGSTAKIMEIPGHIYAMKKNAMGGYTNPFAHISAISIGGCSGGPVIVKKYIHGEPQCMVIGVVCYGSLYLLDAHSNNDQEVLFGCGTGAATILDISNAIERVLSYRKKHSAPSLPSQQTSCYVEEMVPFTLGMNYPPDLVNCTSFEYSLREHIQHPETQAITKDQSVDADYVTRWSSNQHYLFDDNQLWHRAKLSLKSTMSLPKKLWLELLLGLKIYKIVGF